MSVNLCKESPQRNQQYTEAIKLFDKGYSKAEDGSFEKKTKTVDQFFTEWIEKGATEAMYDMSFSLARKASKRKRTIINFEAKNYSVNMRKEKLR